MSRHILEAMSVHGPEPSRVQFVSTTGTRETSFEELWMLSGGMAREVHARVKEGRVAGVLTASAETVAGVVGALRAGRDFVSLPLPGRGQDMTAYARQLAFVAEVANVRTLIVEKAYASLLRSLPGCSALTVLESEALAESAGGGKLQVDPEPGELIQFSSGTTGEPKGIRLDGRAICANVEATLDRLEIGGSPEAFCGWLPLSHDMGLIGGLLATWVGSTRTRYAYTGISPELFLARPSMWMETCARASATITAAPTFAYHLGARHLERGPTLDLSSMRACIIGAEPIGPDTLRTFAAAASRHGFRENALCPAYGLAEMCLAVSMVGPGQPWSVRRATIDGQSGDYVSCGPALSCVRVEAPPSSAEAGPIRVSGPASFSGYVPERRGGGGPVLDTGDLGVLDGDDLVITGRSDDLVCISGRNVFAWELERAASAVPQVRAGGCAVLTDGRGRYVVLFESRTDVGTDLDGTFGELRKRLAAVAGVGPAVVGCLPRGSLAKTPSGKLQRNRMTADLGRLLDLCLSSRQF